MRAPKIVAVASAIDLDFRYGCTPAWWQLWKGLYEAGVDLLVTPYRGRAVESPWWRAAENPCLREGELFSRAKRLVGRRPAGSASLVERWVRPRWQRHLERILARERDVDAVLVFNVPMGHFTGIPTALRERFSVPVVYYDGDVPASLPEHGGFETGFATYADADPSEYDLVVSNSLGGLHRLRELGARRAEAVFWGADPDFFAPLELRKDSDVFFYGYGDEFRRDWMRELVGEPSRRLPEVDFVLGGNGFRADVGLARLAGDVPFGSFRRAVCASRVNLNITRASHAAVHASSTCRPFELAACGAAMVSNPVAGLERWFEPGEEIVVVSDADEATEAYRELLADPASAEEFGRRARERVLDEHTYAHRAAQLMDLIGIGTASRVEVAAGA